VRGRRHLYRGVGEEMDPKHLAPRPSPLKATIAGTETSAYFWSFSVCAASIAK
jgi:hypothetical protein